MLRVAFAGVFAARLAKPVRARLAIPCDVVLDDESKIVSRLPEVDVLVSMKPTAFLINVARAEIVNEEALYRALAKRTIAGAALDVWYRYPTGAGPTLPAHHPFHGLPNVLMTPHVSGWTEGMLEARVKVIAENIHRIARGEPPANLVPSV